LQGTGYRSHCVSQWPCPITKKRLTFARYGTLGHGFLGGKINSLDDLSPKDFRNLLPRFQEEHFNHNLALLKELKRLASEKKCTEAQLALAWVLTLSKRPDMPTIIPIPGSISVERIRENVGAINVELSNDEMKQIDEMVERCGVSGDRYHKHGMDSLDV
jgi:pyridoxine 4-dehydrogenase